MSKKNPNNKWIDSNGELNEELFVKSDFDWSTYKGEVYITPDWIRNPEKYPELIKRLREYGRVWTEGLKKK